MQIRARHRGTDRDRQPLSDRAAGEAQPVVRRCARGVTGANSPDVLPSSETIAPSGSRAPSAAHTASAVSGPVGSSGARRRLAFGRLRRRADRVGERGERGEHASSAGPARVWTSHPSGASQLAFSG